MKVVLAPDKFKGSLTALQVAEAMAAGIREVDPSIVIDLCPLSDGGEGFVATMVDAMGGKLVTHRVTGPLPEMKVDATYGVFDGTAIIEMSSASGLALLRPDQFDPLATTTFGTGQLIAHAVRSGCRNILLGIGGSATCDAGIGAAQACGFTILMRDGEPVSPTEPLCGRDIENVLMVKHGRGETTNGVEITVACDVTNPLYGSQGAAPIFGPQKGATDEQIRWLDEQLRALAQRTGKDEIAQTPGAGAAGGLGFGMLAYFGATMQSGADLVISATRLRERLVGANLCITGEGRFDRQSLRGKAPGKVIELSAAMRVPCCVIAGTIDDEPEHGTLPQVKDMIALVDETTSTEVAMTNAASLVRDRTRDLVLKIQRRTR